MDHYSGLFVLVSICDHGTKGLSVSDAETRW